MTNPTTGAVILAAGAGAPAAPSPAESGGRPFLERVLAAGRRSRLRAGGLRGARRGPRMGRGAADAAGAAVVVNPAPERGALSSLRLGLDRLGARGRAGGSGGPSVRDGRDLPSAGRGVRRPVRRRGQAGGDVGAVIPWSSRGRCSRGSRRRTAPGGLAAVIHASGLREVHLPVDDPGVCRNINFPSDLDESLV